MKCPDCNREYNGKECPYCHDEYQEVKVEPVSKKLLLLSIIGLVLALVSMSVPLLMIVAIGTVIISFYYLKSEKYKKKIIFINVLTIIMLIVSFGSFITPYQEKRYGYKDLEDYLSVSLPHKKCDEYYYKTLHTTKYTYYMYELTSEEYLDILNEGKFTEFSVLSWYVKKVSNLESDYIFFNRLTGDDTIPSKEEDSLYVFLQLEEKDEKYYAHIYNVTFFGSGE